MNRLKRMKRKLLKYRAVIFLTLIIIVGIVYSAINMEYKQLNPDNVINERYRSVNIVSVGEEFEDEDGEYNIHALTDNNEIIVIFSKDKEKILALKDANENNIIEVKGKTIRILDDSVEELKNQYKDWDSYIYEYALERQNSFDIVFDTITTRNTREFFRILIFVFIFNNYFFRKYKNCRKTVKFLKESEDTGLTNYNEGLATFEINNVEIVDNLLIDFKYESFIDLSLYNYFEIYKDNSWLFTKNTIRFFSESGHTKSIHIDIKDNELDMLKDYLYSIEKYEID
ncbi:hypothetical protein [Oceanivirga salmonicida]|uniref:hypothetical protein n=1 Tax=Oceanivirga salmonicida TaxID=1769291 RepID=UPI0012E270B0|nr:hypothetical protein [Oceanivirga salmonicida]